MGSPERLSRRPARVEEDLGPQPPRWLLSRVALAALAAGYLALMSMLVVWTVLPVLWGWSPYVVHSGSMAPAVAVGDVLVAMPSAVEPKVGSIVIVDDPAQPGRLISHRVDRVQEDGTLVTKGDANAAADFPAVDRSQVVGMARLRVPFVGLPQQWMAHQRYGALATWLALSAVAVVAASTDPTRGTRRLG